MATIKRFEDIEAWKQARILCKHVYSIINEGTFAKDYKLRDQINGSSGSVMDNIAEGFERDGRKEFIQFLSIAKGSCGEVRSQLYRAYDRFYISQEKFEELFTLSEKISGMIGKLIVYLKNSGYAGNKFKKPEEPSN
ncbi:MAG: four helix bundle protein [Bacteroidia bacterium]